MINPQDMIDDFESANAKKAQIISKIEQRIQVKEKMLDQKQAMLEEELEVKLPIHLNLSEIEEYFIKGPVFEGRWLPIILIKAFRQSTKLRGGAINVIREEIYQSTQRTANICIVETKRTNNAFFMDSAEFVIYRFKNLQVRIWF